MERRKQEQENKQQVQNIININNGTDKSFKKENKPISLAQDSYNKAMEITELLFGHLRNKSNQQKINNEKQEIIKKEKK